MVYLNRHVAVKLLNWIQLPNQAFFFGGGGGMGVRVGHVRSRRSLEHEFKCLV